jgi:hypothetical protein
MVYVHYDFPKPSVKGFPKAMIPRIATAGTSFSPLPCQTWHEVYQRPPRKGRGRCRRPGERTPLRATSAAPPAGA